MKRIAILFAAFLLPLGAMAEDALMDGGRSPNGEMEVRIVKTEPPAPFENVPYRFEFRAKNKRKPLLKIDGAGYCNYEGAQQTCRALWAPVGWGVAIVERDSRHTTSLQVFAVDASGARLLKLPDYLQNALGRVKATEVDFAISHELKRWEGNDLIFGLNFTANNRILYQCYVTLQFDRAVNTVRLKKMTQPIGQGG